MSNEPVGETLDDPQVATRRLVLLREPHMSALCDFRERLLAKRPGEVPHFDPLDGGAKACLLMLLEKPGRSTLPVRFVSRDNATPTARAIKVFMEGARIPRRNIVLWNAVPWWNGTARVSAGEREDGAAALLDLLGLLPNLRAVVTLGATATKVWRLAGDGRLAHFASAHPSPNVRAAFPDRWAALPQIWANAYARANVADEVEGTGRRKGTSARPPTRGLGERTPTRAFSDQMGSSGRREIAPDSDP